MEALSNKWKSRLPAVPAIPAPAPPVAFPKGAGSKLRVHLNGKVLEYPTAAETFARTIAEIGIDRVAPLDKTLWGPLIGTSVMPRRQQFVVGQYHICTHSNTEVKNASLMRLLTS